MDQINGHFGEVGIADVRFDPLLIELPERGLPVIQRDVPPIELQVIVVCRLIQELFRNDVLLDRINRAGFRIRHVKRFLVTTHNYLIIASSRVDEQTHGGLQAVQIHDVIAGAGDQCQTLNAVDVFQLQSGTVKILAVLRICEDKEGITQ